MYRKDIEYDMQNMSVYESEWRFNGVRVFLMIFMTSLTNS